MGHNLKNLGSPQKTLRPTWCPKLVTGLVASGQRCPFPLACAVALTTNAALVVDFQ